MYDQQFYASQSEGSLRSAQEVVPVIMDLIGPRSVVDLGCGIGTWLSVYKQSGVARVLGIDGDYVSRELLRIEESEFIPRNLTEKLHVNEKFDLVQTVEVAEHLDPRSSKMFISSLTSLGDVIAFAAAIPYQLGTGHVNEQFADYWTALFAERGYYPVDCIRPKIWQNKNIEPWYKQNLILFATDEYIAQRPWMVEARQRTKCGVLSMVHPELYSLRISMLLKVMMEIAQQLRVAQNNSAAEGLYRLVLHHDARIGEAWDALGQITAESGKYEAALEQMERALALSPLAAHYVNASQVCVALGNVKRARKYVKKALRLEPEFMPAKLLLKKL